MGNYSDVGRRFNVSEQTVKKTLWAKLCETEEIGPRNKKGSQNPPHLTETELDLIEFLKQSSPSMTIKNIHDVSIDAYCYRFPVELQEARAVTSRMTCGPMSFKRISARPIVKFTPENVDYCQDYLDYMSSVDHIA